jgi:PilZ domain
MSSTQLSFARRAQGVLSRIVADRRRHKRLSVTMLGRFMRENKQEYPCKLIDISVGGAAIMSPVPVDQGERVVAYFDHIGGIEGLVVRTFDGGFAFKINATQHKREKLAAQLTWLANRAELGEVDERVHERLTPTNGLSSLQLAEGIVLNCRVLDVSISGASIATPARPEIGTEVILGKLRARVVRHHAEGFGVRFLDIQNPSALRRYFGRCDNAPAKS